MQKKEEKYKKRLIFFNSLLPWQRSSEGKQQHKYDCENVTNVAGEFRDHKSQGKKLGRLKHFSPILLCIKF